MATKKPASSAAPALLSPGPSVRVIEVPVVLGVAQQDFPREKIDVRPVFVDFRIAQLTEAELIDQLGAVKKAGKDLEKWEKLAVAVAKSILPEPRDPNDPNDERWDKVESSGLKYQAIRTRPNRHTISLEKLIAKFGESALADCYVDNGVDTLNIKVIE